MLLHSKRQNVHGKSKSWVLDTARRIDHLEEVGVGGVDQHLLQGVDLRSDERKFYKKCSEAR